MEGNEYNEYYDRFTDSPNGTRVISCPICRACLNQRQYKEHGYEPECDILKPIPTDIDNGIIYECKYYKANKESYDYELVKKLMETKQPLK